MEQQNYSTSKVTVEYHDPHDVFKLLAPGLVPRLPLQNLHWQSHAGPLRSIPALHVDLVRAGEEAQPSVASPALRRSDSTARDDGFQTQNVGGRAASIETVESAGVSAATTQGGQRRHQIPGLRRTPYLKVLLVRCDDNDSYKNTVRGEVRSWIKTHATPATASSKKSSSGTASLNEGHDAFEWLIVHVVIPNTAAATQPRSNQSKSDSASTESKSTSSRWRPGSTPLMEKFRSDFNISGKGFVDRVTQIRIGINDVPYDLLPRVVPAVPSGYVETDKDAENAWNDFISKMKDLILSSFDKRVTKYEEGIRERDSQRNLPGWNFCTFFILKEGLARGFETVGLVEDALVGYDELSVGLDSIIKTQIETGAPEQHGGALLKYSEEVKSVIDKALKEISDSDDDEEAVDMQSGAHDADQLDEIAISATKKPYRDMILANDVSVFDFQCYIFARQIALLLRLGNTFPSREELIAKLKEQQDSVLHGVAPRAPPPASKHEETENFTHLAEVCRRTLQFIPAVSQVMRDDIYAAVMADRDDSEKISSQELEVIDNVVSSFAFSVAEQVLAQTSSSSLPVPPSTLTPSGSTLAPSGATEPKASIPEPKTMLHPARSSSLLFSPVPQPPPSPGVFPNPGAGGTSALGKFQEAQAAKTGMEDLAAKRADLYLLSRSILQNLGAKRGWTNGWPEAPLVKELDSAELEEISLDDDDTSSTEGSEAESNPRVVPPTNAGIANNLLISATGNVDDFYRMFEILTDKALRHYTAAGQDYSAQAQMADLAVLKFHLKEYRQATYYFSLATPFFGESGWSSLELSMLIMYSKSLRELQSKQEFVKIVFKLLTKACAGEKERLALRSTSVSEQKKAEYPDLSLITSVAGNVSELTEFLPKNTRISLASFMTEIDLVGAPVYHEDRDSCSLTVKLRCLLPDGMDINAAELRMTSLSGGPAKEVKFSSNKNVRLTRGMNTVTVDTNSIVPGTYRVDHFNLSSNHLTLHYDRDLTIPVFTKDETFPEAEVTLYQRVNSLDVNLTATKHTALDRTNSLDLALSTGWNDLASCEIRVKPTTGGLRLVTTDATFVDSSDEFAKPPEAGLFFLGPVDKDTTLTLRFPYTIEQDFGQVGSKVEVNYTTKSGETFYLAKAISISVSLAVGVNVQDVFKHDTLFSRFSVTTASSNPIRLYKSQLIESELFGSSFGIAPTETVTIFAKQPASLLYKVRRKTQSAPSKRSEKTMYLKLHYTELLAEMQELVSRSFAEYLEQQDSPLAEFAKPIGAVIAGRLKSELDVFDLEHAALLGEVPTKFLKEIPWKRQLRGLGKLPGTEESAATAIAGLLEEWQRGTPAVPIPKTNVTETSSILIPMEMPSVSVLHTANIRLQPPPPGLTDGDHGAAPAVTINQVLSATLQLKWTRIWDTDSTRKEDQEFSYEVIAPGESWLIGGRRKGHFVIPYDPDMRTSTPETEADIPLVLIPQREGWLPYPTVEIKEISQEDGRPLEPAAQTFEIDWRNLGETIRVVNGRTGVTVSLDASGPGGGPMVLEQERITKSGRMRVL
ncbi:unnamed protein product [Clonostachys rosea f. rosea IK726]|uniref:Trafficking protein particle complex subunit 10 n=2 Tax=Bionectria ochroleuca TaxID=29856 RepID=A0A0B7KCV2_BIOOC|nr:unnamed protein product [Clonostachys rosea f. rosea IK726]